MADELLRREYHIQGRDFERAGESSTLIKEILKGVGIDPTLIRRAVVIVFEAEMNVVMYAEGGTVTLVLTEEEIRIEVADRGPGIPDIEQAMQEGYSTAADDMREMGFGFGMGLPNIRRNSDLFTISSDVGRGTTVQSSIRLDGHG